MLERARELLGTFDSAELQKKPAAHAKERYEEGARRAPRHRGGETQTADAHRDRERHGQLGLFAAHHPLVDELAGIDTNSMTPLDALMTLSRLVSRAKQG